MHDELKDFYVEKDLRSWSVLRATSCVDTIDSDNRVFK